MSENTERALDESPQCEGYFDIVDPERVWLIPSSPLAGDDKETVIFYSRACSRLVDTEGEL